MRMTESEYQDFINKRATSIKDVGRALGIPPSNKHALELAENMTPPDCKPVHIAIQPPAKVTKSQVKRGPNKTELEYSRLLALEFTGALIWFEGISFKMLNGHKYTPDWIVCGDNFILCVEVKARGRNGFRHPSYQRARLAFDQCRADLLAIQFRWAEKQNGLWNID